MELGLKKPHCRRPPSKRPAAERPSNQPRWDWLHMPGTCLRWQDHQYIRRRRSNIFVCDWNRHAVRGDSQPHARTHYWFGCASSSHKKRQQTRRPSFEASAGNPQRTSSVCAGSPYLNVTDQSRDSLFRKAVTRAGIKGLTFHDTRHEAITKLAKKLNILELTKILDHKDIRQIQIYYNESASEIAKKLWMHLNILQSRDKWYCTYLKWSFCTLAKIGI